MKAYVKQLNNKGNNEEGIKKIIELWNENAMETAECELDENDRMAVQDQLEQFIQSKYGTVFVVMNEFQHIVAYAIASIKKDLVSDMLYGQIDEVYVTKKYRRKKVAQNLVDHLITWLNQEEITAIHVYVDLDNKLALEFWEKSGFDREFFVLSNN